MVETLLALMILAVGIAGASRLIAMTMKLSDLSTEKTTSVQLAVNRIEKMDMAGFDDLPAWTVGDLVCDGQGNPSRHGNFRISTEVAYVQTNLAEIVIQVATRNRISLEFDKSPEQITSYLTDL